MSDFATAFQQGLHAFQDVERARREIDETLKDFAEQVSAASGERVQVRKEPRPELGTVHVLNPTTGGVREVFGRTYLALMVSSPDAPDQKVELCRYTLGPTGYPVRLRYDHTEAVCSDRAELVAGLQQMLADPWAGGVFSRVMTPAGAAPSGG